MLCFETGKVLDQCVLYPSMRVYGVLHVLLWLKKHKMICLCAAVSAHPAVHLAWVSAAVLISAILVAGSHFVRRLYLEFAFYKTF